MGGELCTLKSDYTRTFFNGKAEKTRSIKEEMDREVFVSRQSWHFSFIDNMIKVLVPIRTLKSLVNNYASRQGKGINRRNECIITIIIIITPMIFHNLIIDIINNFFIM